LHCPGEQHQHRLLVLLAAAREDFGPGVLGAAQDCRDEVGHLVLACRSLRRDLRLRGGRDVHLLRALHHDARVDSEEHCDQRDHHDADAAASEPAPAGHTHPATILDVLAAALVFDSHGRTPSACRRTSIAKLPSPGMTR
jgi:hypothetical protein